ncbi:MAG TPA: glucoamylase family protein [Anaerolineales bacterium]|nr:glucoamylase family protein [Anaerolineales bacterium]
MPVIPHRTKGRNPSDLSAIDRWKLFDNLRRSLTSPAILGLIFGGWLFLPGLSWFWIALALFPYFLSTIFGIIAVLRARRDDQHPDATSRPGQQAILRSLLQVIFLPHEAIIALDAIATTIVRMIITRKRLLQWVTAAHTVRIFGRDLKVQIAWNEMMFAPFISLFLFFVLVAVNPMALWLATPFLVTWAASPYIATKISRRYTYRRKGLDSSQTKQLRLLARSTWLYFERFVGPEDHWLPPDHFQEEPRGIVAHRTSPTNIGLLLLSTLSAYDLGYIGLRELAIRIRNTFDGMDQLEKHRKHLLNWYDTRTLEPLPPRYISTVDNGNLAASLIALREGCMDVGSKPIMRWEGLIDTLDMLDMTLREAKLGKKASELSNVISTLREQAENLHQSSEDSSGLLLKLFDEGRVEMEKLLAKVVEASAKRLDSPTIRRLSSWIERTRHHLQNIQSDMEHLYPWSLALAQTPVLFRRPNLQPDLRSVWNELQAALPSRPALQAIPAICDQATEILARLRGLLDREEQEAVEWCETFTTSLQSAGKAAGELLDELSSLGDHAASYVQAMNFRFLYNPRRKVFHIGYNVDTGMLDSSYYDLLASEARLTSLVAIAKGDVPQSHWLYLARPITQLEGMRTLLSWSGTMFEYLMPILLTKRYRNTLLDQSCRAAVKHQISYSKQDSQTPWGISESGFYYFDSQQAYQYRAFGVPGLGYKRGLGEDYVVAPYASVLALPYAPQAVIENLELFQKLEMFGLYGLFESIDFTDERLAKGQDFAIVRSYMAHHQGMILLSLCNFLRKDIMVQRFHADPHIETVKLLLQEDIPVYAPIEYARPKEIGSVHSVNAPISLEPWQAEPQAPYPHVHFLSNGNYGLLITAAGSGYSRWQDVDLTRWRADTTLDQYGTYVYIQDMQTGRLWSTTHQPTAISADKLDVRFSPHAAEFMRRDKTITSQMQVTIAAEADVEIRRLSLTNHDGSARDLVLTSFAEVILSPQWTDQRHPAYNKLFIESEYIASENILLFRRRPRSADDKPIYLAHFVVDEDGALDVIGYETDRRRFLGRGYTPRNPAALQHGSGLINMANTLDPIFALQAQISVPGYDSRQLAFVTLAAPSREEALDLAVQYRQWHYVIRAFTDAHMQAEQELTQIGLSSPALAQIQKLLSALLYPAPTLRSNSSILARNKLGQSGLWAFGISGDYPILLLSLKEQKDLGLLNELLRAHHYWRRRRLKIDLVIVNRRETSYDQNFQGVIYRLLRRTRSDKWLGKRGGIFVLREDQMSEAEQILLATVARVVLDGEAGTLQEQLQKLDQNPIRLPRHVPLLPANTEPEASPVTQRPSDLLFDNGTGGFTADGREYVIYLERGQWTPAPWTNVIANPEFGFLVTEAGMGCTWAINSGENRLTPWHNDAVSDPPAEAIYLRDEDTGEIWTPTPLPTRADAPYLVRHGVGYSIFELASHHLEQNLKIFAVPDAPLKLVRLKLKNTSSRTRRINVTYYAEWVLGKTHEETAQFIVPEFASEHFALLASNSYNQDFSQRVAFLAATRELQGLTTDRVEFLGSLGSYAQPQALERMGLTASALAGKDPCAALQLLLWLAPGEEKEVTFLLGQGEDRADALRLISQYRDLSNVEAAWQSLEQFWDERIGGVQIKTPDPAMDLLVNRWLPYQALSCRIWGRTAFYQSGGAFGFRDQLQDVMLFLHTWPEMARQHILEAARHQFEEGDVLHWWHPPGNRGVRTRITDNLLWLPYVTSQYVKVTGDLSILDEQITFLSAEPLQAGEHERYGEFPAGSAGSLYEHCRRALIKGTTSGPHGLPLMGGGDWNDGMNNIGSGGTGESVWLGWFLYNTLMDFSKISERLPSVDNAAGFRQQAEFLQAALESHAWDGNWYRRAYYDDGTPVGSVNNIDCQIDSISQSWAVISGAGSRERVRIAMDSLYERLVRKDAGLVLLLTPPFDRTIRDPGYIKGYLPGIRENGGQYTHAAIWALWAFADLGQAERVHELFRMINPIYEADTPEKVTRYFVEPYVVAADVYSHPEHLGHGGWTWYTGSSPWMTRLVLEKILGLQREGNQLRIEPCIPADWPHYEIQYRFGHTLYHLRIENPHGVSSSVTQYTLDGTVYTDDSIILEDDGGEHHVTVTIGEKTYSKGKTVRKVRKSK